MTQATTKALVPALREVREAEAAVIDRFRVQIAVTPAGHHRQILERHVDQAHDHVNRLDERLEELRSPGVIPALFGQVFQVAERATEWARLPFDLAMAVPTGVWQGRGRSAEQQLLKNAEDAYALTAFAVAACRAGERIARQADGAFDANLLASVRRENEELLKALGGSVEERAEAVVAAARGDRSGYRIGSIGAVQAARTAVARAGARRRRMTREAGRAAQRVPGVTRTQGRVRGAASTQEQLPIADYEGLTAAQIIEQLPQLSQFDLARIEGYERSHASRSTVLDKIDDLRQSEPWTGYDTMRADEVCARLGDAKPDRARQVLTYERRHRARSTVTAAAERILA